MASENTTDSIIAKLKVMSGTNEVSTPETWLRGAMKLSVLREEDDDQLITLRQAVAQAKAELIEKGSSVAKAEILVETLPIYMQYKKQEAKCERIAEYIRIAKHYARLKNEQMSHYT